MKNTLILDAEQLIKNANDNIEKNIDVLCPDNVGLCAQNILSQLRNLIDAFALLQLRIDGLDDVKINGSERIKKAISHLKSDKKKFSSFIKMHEYIQMVSSHYTQDQFGSTALLQRYSDLLEEVRKCAKKEFDKTILNNIDKFPFEIKNQLKEYYVSVYETLKGGSGASGRTSTFYVEKKRRRYISSNTFVYEYVLSPANDKKTKFDRLTAFSLLDINRTHSIKCTISTIYLDVSGIKTNVSIIEDYSVSIRPCEIKMFASLEKFEEFSKGITRETAGYKPLMAYLTKNAMTLYDLIMLDDCDFNEALVFIQGPGKNNSILDFLRYTRHKINKRELGFKTLTYLLYMFRHKLMKSQRRNSPFDGGLGDTLLSEGCSLFEMFPFSFSLKRHNPSIDDLIECLNEFSTSDQLLKRKVVYNTETKKQLFTPVNELDEYYLSQDYVDIYNSRLPDRVISNSLALTPDGRYIYSKNYVDDTKDILNYLRRKSSLGCDDYRALAERYLSNNPNLDIDDLKKGLLQKAFVNSQVIVVNGAAGTGKTTTITHLSKILEAEKVLFLSCTNASVQNLRHKVGISGNRTINDFKTIEAFLTKESFSLPFYKTVVIDECSTVSNKDFKRIISKKDFDRLVLVGDEEQIESIRFGNWFGIAKYELDCSFELSDNHRTKEHNVETIWRAARDYNEKMYELLMSGGFVSDLNNSIFEKTTEDEVILCLNYDGFYGINNINRYMQEINPGKGVSWGVWSFKEGDRVLFNESYYFRDYFYNNQKGLITKINETEEKIIFEVRVDKEEGNSHISNLFVKYIQSDEGYDYYRIFIDKNDDNDDEESAKVLIVPFQLGYALSIHKAQGLEYDSVKVVLTKEVEESISHNIFYTAITRCRKKLKIYCDPDSLNKILSGYHKKDYSKDSKLIRTIQF